MSIRTRIESAQTLLAHLRWVLRLVWTCQPILVATVVGATLLQSLIPAATAYVSKLIVDSVVRATSQPEQGWSLVVQVVLIAFALALAGSVVGSVAQLARDLLANRLFGHINEMIITHASSLELSHFEDPSFHDMLERAKTEAGDRPLSLISHLLTVASSVVMISSFLFLLMHFNLWVVLILMATTLPSIFVQVRHGRQAFRLRSFRVPESRQMLYYTHLLTTEQSVKEIRLFALAKMFLSRYRALFDRFYRQDRSLAVRRRVAGFGFSLLSLGGFYGCYLYVVARAINRAITLGDLTLYAMAFQQLQTSLRSLLDSVSAIYESALFLSNLHSFFQIKPSVEHATERIGRTSPARWQKGISFHGVSFRYPNNPTYALENINLQIGPGDKVALVGENGAGKTTLVKLLTRLYEPTAGRITLDGIDVREYDAESYCRNISVIFQDFTHYYLTARENIGLGQVDALDDIDRIRTAANKSGAHEIISRLPSGYETMLGRWFRSGHQLSLGEWQKVALARAFMREAQLVILDEPTASLDARAEYQVFQHFNELARDKATVLISHRFNTVRIADRIVVLSDHCVAEEGTHAQLVKQDGLYAKLFRMQAAPYVNA